MPDEDVVNAFGFWAPVLNVVSERKTGLGKDGCVKNLPCLLLDYTLALLMSLSHTGCLCGLGCGLIP
ncbi:MAG: hypothetical protein LBT59_24470 [Clostridiales bacterium]|nr:hypothetical protein [Clostridiales bacterium]